MTYITLDGYVDDLDHGHIENDARLMHIDAAPDDLEAALAAECNDFDAIRAVEGEVGDAWLQFHGRPKKKVILQAARDLGFVGDLKDLIIRWPGQNPGGPYTWVDPRADVYVFEYAPDEVDETMHEGLRELESKIAGQYGVRTRLCRDNYAGREGQPMLRIWDEGKPHLWDRLRQAGLFEKLSFAHEWENGTGRGHVYVYTPDDAEDVEAE